MSNGGGFEHVRNLSGFRYECKHFGAPPRLGHPDKLIGDNNAMQKLSLRQILAKNLLAAMERNPNLDTQVKLAAATGISQSHLSEILRCITSVSLDLVETMSTALKVEAWELLADSDTTRAAAMARLLWKEGASNDRVAEFLPPAPQHVPPAPKKKEAARRRKKPDRGSRGSNPGGARRGPAPSADHS
jgi:transcriptional regulator with XRE-family HTH domain